MWLKDDGSVDEGSSSGDRRSEMLWEEEQGLTSKLDVDDEGK